MSLVAWFPLNGNLNNYGCSDYTLTNSNATVSTDGKIGKCYSFNGTNSYLTSNFSYQNFGNNVSIAFWVKIPSFTSDNQLLWGTNQNGPFIDIKSTSIRCYLWAKNADGTIGSSKSYTYDFSSYINTWVHVCFTFNGTSANLYLNGELKKSANWNCDVYYKNVNCLIGRWTSGRWLNGLANDYRIYNHCLSQKEVHEISKGLVVHYKLDDLNNINLLTWSKEYSKTNPYIHTSKGTDGYLYMGNDSLITIKPNTKYTIAFNCDGNISVHGSGVTRTYPNKDFTFWFYIRNTGTTKNVGQYDSTACFNKDNSTLKKIGDRFIFTWTSPSTAQDITIRTNTYSNGTDNIIVKFWDIMIVEGDYDASIFSPGINQPQARNYVVDNSGFLNNASTNGSLQIANDSPVYEKSLKFADSSYLRFKLPTNMDIVTYSFWVKPKAGSGSYGSITHVFNDPSSGKSPWIAVNTEGNKLWFYKTGGTGGGQNNYHKVSGTLTNDVWYHAVFVWNKGNTTWYLNGAKQSTTTNWNGQSFTNSSDVSIGDSYTGTFWATQFLGQLSDFRIYSTALTDADVEELYKVGASIDKTGNTFTNQFVEKTDLTNVKINKNKQIYVKELQELLVKYDNTIYTEADGSKWVKIVHHNNPADTNNLFKNTDPFDNFVYKNSNAWFNGSILNYLTSWELIYECKASSTSTLTRYRWIQTVNPLKATYNDTTTDKVTHINTGYTTTTIGGLYKKNSSTYLCCNNGKSDNWMVAVGSWTAWSGGIPGWTAAITDGYLNVYVRIPEALTKIYKNDKKIYSIQFIENDI